MEREDPLLECAGIVSFLRAPLLKVEQIKPGTTAVLGVPTDYTRTGRPGARYGPRAIREASLVLAKFTETSATSQALDPMTGKTNRYNPRAGRLADVGDVHIYPTDVMKTTESIRTAVRQVMERDAFPVVLGGDHYISYPAFLGFSDVVVARKSNAKIGYIQFDAHLDIGDSSALMGRLYNGTNARRILEMPMVDPPNMVWIGTSHFVRQEQWDFLHKSGCHAYTVGDVERLGIKAVVEEAWELASKGCDTVYLTIDIDGIDCAWASGTGTINIHGLRPADLLEAVDILSTLNVGIVDLVEVAPNLDTTGVTAWIAAAIVLGLIRPRISEPLA